MYQYDSIPSNTRLQSVRPSHIWYPPICKVILLSIRIVSLTRLSNINIAPEFYALARYDQELGALAGLSSTNVGKLVHEQLALQMVILKEVSNKDDDADMMCR